jgi:hypothetical protein
VLQLKQSVLQLKQPVLQLKQPVLQLYSTGPSYRDIVTSYAVTPPSSRDIGTQTATPPTSQPSRTRRHAGGEDEAEEAEGMSRFQGQALGTVDDRQDLDAIWPKAIDDPVGSFQEFSDLLQSILRNHAT